MNLKIITWCLGVLVVLAFINNPAHAERITRDMAIQYFQNCTANPEPRFSEETQKMFCACTASQMTKSFTVDDMRAIGNPQSQNARKAMNKMIIYVYAPCIRFPAKEYHYQTCIDDPKTKAIGNPEDLCSCAANKVTAYLQQNSGNKFRSILRKNPQIQDPMQALYNDAEFQRYARSQLMSCIGM